MADILLDQQSAPATPASGQGILYFDTVSKHLTYRRDNGQILTPNGIQNASVAAQAYTTAEIYLMGSALAVPSHLLQVGAKLRWRIVLTKTAGTGLPVFIVKIGTLGTTGDTAICTFTGFAGATSAADTAWVDIEMVVRTIGASATSEGAIRMNHALAATGFSNLTTAVQRVDGTAFNSTTAALIAGVTFNHGTAGAGNIEIVSSELING